MVHAVARVLVLGSAYRHRPSHAREVPAPHTDSTERQRRVATNHDNAFCEEQRISSHMDIASRMNVTSSVFGSFPRHNAGSLPELPAAYLASTRWPSCRRSSQVASLDVEMSSMASMASLLPSSGMLQKAKSLVTLRTMAVTGRPGRSASSSPPNIHQNTRLAWIRPQQGYISAFEDAWFFGGTEVGMHAAWNSSQALVCQPPELHLLSSQRSARFISQSHKNET